MIFLEFIRICRWSIVCLCLIAVPSTATAEEAISWPGKVSQWKGYTRYDFELHGRPAIVVTPGDVAAGRPWIWRARFFGHRPELDLALLKSGYHLVYCDVAHLFGSPQAVKHWDRCYETLTKQYELGQKPVLEGMSRGGLIVFNWTVKHPDRVSCLYVDAPVCDIKSWPGGRGQGKGSPTTWKSMKTAYGFKSDEEAEAWTGNPLDHRDELANTKLPLFVVTGDADDVVPMEENILPIVVSWKKVKAPLQVVVKPGIGHKHGLEDPEPLIEFVRKYSR
jgi:pimeloyl-ACP methyl ester carboxylesterase